MLEQCFWLLANVCGESERFRDYVMQRIDVYAPMKRLVSTSKISKSLLKTICWLNSNIQRYRKLSQADVINGLNIANAGLYTEDNDIVSDCLWAINYMADTDDDILIGHIASTETLPKVIECVGDKDFSVFVPALRALGNILTTNDTEVVERALFQGALDKLTTILYSPNANLIKEVCWALSNICAGPSSHIAKLVDSTAFDRVFFLANSYNIDHRKEALWVICNAITGGDEKIKITILRYNSG